MKIIFGVLIPLVSWSFIIYLIANWGNKKQIGFLWSLYFGIISPLIAFFLVIISRKKSRPSSKLSVFGKIIAVIFILYGSVLILGGISTKNSPSINEQQNGRLSLPNEQEELMIENFANGQAIALIARNFGSILGGGFPSLLLSEESLIERDYKWKRHYRIYVGLILVSLGTFLFRKRRTTFLPLN